MWTLFVKFCKNEVVRPQGCRLQGKVSSQAGGKVAARSPARPPAVVPPARPPVGKDGRSAVTAAEPWRAAPPSPLHKYDAGAFEHKWRQRKI